MALPSPWRASGVMLALGGGTGLVLGVVLRLDSGSLPAAVAVALVTALMLGGAELQAALRLNWALREFAGQVPGTPEASASPWGDQRVEWPDLGLAASGETHRFRVLGLDVETDGRGFGGSLHRPRETAREALAARGHAPAFDDPDDRLPSVYPRLSAIRVGVPVGAAALVLAALADLPASPTVAGGLPLGIVVLGGGVRWAGLAGVRRGLVALSAGLQEGGVAVEYVDLVGGLVAPAFAVHTDAGTAAVRCVAQPWGRLRATVGDQSVRGRVVDGQSVGRDAAALLRESEGVETRVDSGDLVTTGRVFSAVFGACSVAFGGLLVVRPGVVTGGECTRACLLEQLLEAVPFLHVAFGGLLVLFGLASLAVAVGRLPVPGRSRP